MMTTTETTSRGSQYLWVIQRLILWCLHQHHPQSHILLCNVSASGRSEAPRQQVCKNEMSKPTRFAARARMQRMMRSIADPISPAERVAGRAAEINNMLTICSPSTTHFRKIRLTVKCRIAVHGFLKWFPTDPRCAATPLRVTLRLLLAEAAAQSRDAEFFDVTMACKHTPCTENFNPKMFANCGFVSFALIAAVFGCWCLGYVHVAGVACVAQRSDSERVRFDYEAPCCACNISSENRNPTVIEPNRLMANIVSIAESVRFRAGCDPTANPSSTFVLMRTSLSR